MVDFTLMLATISEAEKSLQNLSHTILNKIKPLPGPYGLFNHISQAMGRLSDCKYILKRLYEGRDKFNILEIQKALPDNDKYILETETNAFMNLDLESLYVFGAALLDQWAIISLYISGHQNPEMYKHPYHEIIINLDKGEKVGIEIIWVNYKVLMLWLDYQVRFYRNRFVVHSDRPWQRGTTRSVYGDDYCLFIPSPPGWLDESKIILELKQLSHLIPKELNKLLDENGYRQAREIIQALFNDIGNIEKREDRERVSRLFGKVGGSTPTFQLIADNIFTFILLGTNLLNDIANENIKSVNIGRSKEL